jgi:hypothetical protein
VRTFVAAYGPTRDRSDFRDLLADPDRVLRDPTVIFDLEPSPFMSSLFRNELVVFAPRAAAGGGYEAPAVFHLLPGTELGAVRDELLPPSLVGGVESTFHEPEGADHGSPTDDPSFRTLLATIREQNPGAVVGPYFLQWSATDSRFFRELGIPSYGFTPFVVVVTDTFSMDLANERLGLAGFVDGVRLYAEVVRRLAS